MKLQTTMSGMLIFALVVALAVCRGSASAADKTVWKGPRVQRISLVGLFDLDGDGISDRNMLHRIIKSSGMEIDNEVDDHGRRSGKRLTRHTILLVGKILDPKNGSPKKRAAARKIAGHHRDMLREAKKLGVRVETLSDFIPGFVARKKPEKASVTATGTEDGLPQLQLKLRDPHQLAVGSRRRVYHFDAKTSVIKRVGRIEIRRFVGDRAIGVLFPEKGAFSLKPGDEILLDSLWWRTASVTPTRRTGRRSLSGQTSGIYSRRRLKQGRGTSSGKTAFPKSGTSKPQWPKHPQSEDNMPRQCASGHVRSRPTPHAR